MQLSFFDCFLKDDDYGGWKSGKQAPVRFSVRKGMAPMGTLNESEVFPWRDEAEWPLSRTRYEKFYFHADQSLVTCKPSSVGVLSYQGLTWVSIFSADLLQTDQTFAAGTGSSSRLRQRLRSTRSAATQARDCL